MFLVFKWLLLKWNKVRKISMLIISAFLTGILQVYFGGNADIYDIIGDLIGVFLGNVLKFYQSYVHTRKNPHLKK